MCLNVSLIVLKISKSFLPGSILINLQPSFCLIVFSLLISMSIFLSVCPFLLRAYSHENVSQFYNLRHYTMFECFAHQMSSLFLLFLLYLVLNSCADVVLKSMITLIANITSIKIFLHYFFGSSTSSYLCFL